MHVIKPPSSEAVAYPSCGTLGFRIANARLPSLFARRDANAIWRRVLAFFPKVSNLLRWEETIVGSRRKCQCVLIDPIFEGEVKGHLLGILRAEVQQSLSAAGRSHIVSQAAIADCMQERKNTDEIGLP